MSTKIKKEYEKAFHDGILLYNIEFFTKLKEKCIRQYDYDKNQRDTLVTTLEYMKRFGIQNKNNLHALTLEKALDFGLFKHKELVDHLGIEAINLTKRTSLAPQIVEEEENRRESYAFTVATSLSDDYADEDFEDDDDNDNINSNRSFKNNWNTNSTISTAFELDETNTREKSPMYMSKANDLHELDSEIEDETSNPVNSPPYLPTKYRAESKHIDSDDDHNYNRNNYRNDSKSDNIIKSNPILPQPKISLREPDRNITNVSNNYNNNYNEEKYQPPYKLNHKKHNKTASWIINHKWTLGDKIGHGSFGAVFQGMNDKGQLFAVKTLHIAGKESEVDKLAEEIELMRDLSHPNTVQYLGTWIDEEKGTVYIFQEWVPGGSIAHLLKKFGPFGEDVIRNYTRQILQGLKYLHENGIVHRDIKGGNILVDLGTVKLADFGASKKSDFEGTQATTTIRGTPYFMAPEVLSENRYGRKGDIWAVGCTIIQMLTGEPPWKDQNLSSLIQLHMLLTTWSKGIPPLNATISKVCRDFLELCFQKDESRRPYTTDLLTHIFLRDDEMDGSLTSNPESNYSYNHNNVSHRKNQSNYDNDDTLEDSIRTKLGRAVSRASITVDHISSNSTTDDDTINKIDKKILYNEQNNRYATPYNNKPLYLQKVDSPPIYSPNDLVSGPSSSSNNPFAKGKTSISKDIVARASVAAFTPPSHSNKYNEQDHEEEEIKIYKPNDYEKPIEKPKIITSYRYQSNRNTSQSSARDSEILTPLTNEDEDDNNTKELFTPKKLYKDIDISSGNIKGISNSVKRAVAIGSSRQSIKMDRKPSLTTIDKQPISRLTNRLNDNNSNKIIDKIDTEIDLNDWKCLNTKCNSMNRYDDPFCIRCAVIRGGTGSRASNEVVPLRRS